MKEHEWHTTAVEWLYIAQCEQDAKCYCHELVRGRSDGYQRWRSGGFVSLQPS